MKKILLTLLLALPFCMATKAQDFRKNKNVVVLSGVFSTYGSDPAFGWELSYYRYLFPYVGVTGGIAYQNWGIIPTNRTSTQQTDGDVISHSKMKANWRGFTVL